jgi:dTMP kinase
MGVTPYVVARVSWFAMSIVMAGASVGLLTFAWHLSVAILGVVLVGVAAGMAFLSGTTLLGGEVDDSVRGRVFGFVNMSTRVVLMLAIALSSVLVGVGSTRTVNVLGLTFDLSTTRVLLLAAGVVGVLAGIAAFRQMDDKPGVPVFKDLISSLRGRPIGVPELAMRRSLFVVFEGGEGAGKSTQAQLLAETLRGEGRPVLVTREPGATDVGKQIRSLLLDRGATTGPAGVVLAPRAEALLYAADRAHHVASVVRPALAQGTVVLSDRYVDSSLAYQGAGRTLPVDEISWLSSWATGGLKPDLVVLLDIDPSHGLKRVTDRSVAADRLENESVEFHERVRFAFLDLAAADPQPYPGLDATAAPDAIAAAVAVRVRAMLPAPPDQASSHPGGTASAVNDRVLPPPPAVEQPILPELDGELAKVRPVGRLLRRAHA